MKIMLNGEERETASQNLHQLINELQLEKRTIAIELNLNVIPRSEYAKTPLKEGDRIEVVHMIGGG